MSGWSEDVDPNEILVGAEAYQRMVSDCEERLALSNARIDGYEGTRATLKSIIKTCNQDLLVPVAGGLAYFEGTIKRTNNVLVLLGESLFAEHCVEDALGIAERRIGYLKAERSAIEIEKKQIEEKQSIFLACGAEGSATDSKIGVVAPSPSATASKTSTKAAPSTSSSQNNQQSSQRAGGGNVASSSSANGNTNSYEGLSAADAELAKQEGQGFYGDDDDNGGYDEEDEDDDDNLIDPQDELTLDELIALEEELGEDINDEEKAEAAIMDLVNKKKAIRIAKTAAEHDAVLAARGGGGGRGRGGGGAATAASTHSPSDEGKKSKQAATATTSVDATTANNKPSAAGVTKKSVHFDATSGNTTTNTTASSSSNLLQMTAAATAFASPADIGKMFTNLGEESTAVAIVTEKNDEAKNISAASDKEGNSIADLDDEEASEYLKAKRAGEMLTAPPKSSVQISATGGSSACAVRDVPMDTYSVESSPYAFSAAPAAAAVGSKEKAANTAKTNASGGKSGPVKDVIVEKNIVGAFGAVSEKDLSSLGVASMVGGVGGAAKDSSAAATSANPAVGSANTTATIKKRSLFGQNLGLK